MDHQAEAACLLRKVAKEARTSRIGASPASNHGAVAANPANKLGEAALHQVGLALASSRLGAEAVVAVSRRLGAAGGAALKVAIRNGLALKAVDSRTGEAVKLLGQEALQRVAKQVLLRRQRLP